MSWAPKFIIQFQSITGKNYTVQILVDGYTGDAIPLQGAASPFSTTESTSEDYFEPIRTQSGYIRIIDTGADLDGNAFDWKTLLPSTNAQHQVRLLNEDDEIEWIGYMKAEMFTTTLFDYGTEYEFPIICPLEMLESLQLSFTSTEMDSYNTIHQALYLVLSSAGIDWQQVWFPANVLDYGDINARFNYMNFFTDIEPVTVSGATHWEDDESRMSDVLNEICRFFGWTLYSRGRNLYFMAADDVQQYRVYAFTVLASDSAIAFSANGETVSLSSLEYLSNEHSIDVLMGRNKIEIKARVSEEETVMQPDLEQLDYSPFEGGKVRYGDYYSYQWVLNMTENPMTANLNGVEVFIRRVVNSSGTIGATCMMDDNWKVNEDYTKKTFSFKKDVGVYQVSDLPVDMMAQRMISFETACPVYAPMGSMIAIDAGARRSLNPSVNTNYETQYKVRMFLRIGDKYYNADSRTWTSVPVAFSADLYQAALYDTRPQFDGHLNAKGYCINMETQSVHGKMMLGILMNPTLPSGDTSVMLNNIRVGIYSEENSIFFPENKAEQIYSGVGSNNFKENVEVDLSFASGNRNKNGKGQLYNFDGSYLTTLTYPDGEITRVGAPEIHLLKRYRRMYGQFRERMQVEVRPTSTNIKPTTVFTHTNGKTYAPQSISREWADEKIRLTIVEI